MTTILIHHLAHGPDEMTAPDSDKERLMDQAPVTEKR